MKLTCTSLGLLSSDFDLVEVEVFSEKLAQYYLLIEVIYR